MSNLTGPVWRPFAHGKLIDRLSALRVRLDTASADALRRDAERIEAMARHVVGSHATQKERTP